MDKYLEIVKTYFEDENIITMKIKNKLLVIIFLIGMEILTFKSNYFQLGFWRSTLLLKNMIIMKPIEVLHTYLEYLA